MEPIKGLKDIKGIVEVTDYSLWWLLGLIAAVALFLGAPEYARLVKALEPYKYKKEVPAMEDKLKEEIRQFIKEIKWES